MEQGQNSGRELDPLQVPLEGFALIEASAGTGKTHTITTLYLRLLLERELKVENILVVTFTNAAAAELHQRLRQRIGVMLSAVEGEQVSDSEVARLAKSRCAPEVRARDRVLLKDAWYNFDLAAVLTIHAFCQRMLGQYAFEGGLRFDATVVADANRALNSAVTGYWLGIVERTPNWALPLLHEAAESDGKETVPSLFDSEARELLAQLVRAKLRFPTLRIVWPDSKNSPDPARNRNRAWNRYLCHGLGCVLRELQREKDRRRVRSFDDLLRELREALRSRQGAQLAAAIYKQFPAALIDEFQDTDPLQYDIFRTVYESGTEAGGMWVSPDSNAKSVDPGVRDRGGTGCWFVIGDPKQAIYAFRGADVFAYLRAKRDAKRQYTLRRNYRSAPELVAAVNLLFRRVPKPFLIDGIDVEPAEAARQPTGNPRAGLEIVTLWGAPGVSMTQAWGKRKLPPIVAAEIEELVRSGLQFGEHQVEYSSIAVLCRTNEQASLVQKALRERGIPSALESEASVFDSLEARELETVLRALLAPTSRGYVRAAMATTLVGVDASEISLLDVHESLADEWSLRFAAWGDLWRRTGLLSALEALFHDRDVLPRVLGRVDGERCVTNVRHLAELLQRASVAQRLSPEETLQWLARMRAEPEARLSDEGLGEAAQLRLESDGHAVKLVTIHKSKGLQYPVVICPFLWDEPNPRPRGITVFHDATSYMPMVDVCRPPLSSSVERLVWESRAEGRRLLYVALTRAEYLCTVFWGPFSNMENSALAGLLHPELFPSAAKSGRRKKGPEFEESMRQSLETLAREANGTIRVRSPVPSEIGAKRASKASASRFVGARAQRVFTGSRWAVKSFSALLAEERAPLSVPAAEGADYDRATRPVAPQPPPEDAVLLANLPSGTRTGQWLHWLLETVDFSVPLEAQLDLLEEARHRLSAGAPSAESEPISLEVLARALEELLTAPLVPVGIRLRDLAPERRVAELGFVLPVWPTQKGSSTGTRGVDPERLAAVLARGARSKRMRSYAQQLRFLPFREWHGFLKGYIDLLFEHEGRWYVVDYKSNDLGPRPRDYKDRRLQEAMAEHHYILQYHLYTVAADRFLEHCLPDYDYERHFGGVLYLFVRGISPRYPEGNGIFFDRPPREMVAALARLFEGENGA